MGLWAKLLAFFPEVVKGNSGAAPAINWDAGTTQSLTLNAATVTPTFAAPPAGCDLKLLLTQDGTGGRLVTWPAAVTWIGGSPPVLLPAAAAVSQVSFYFDGTTYWGTFPAAMGTGQGAVQEIRFAITNAAAQNSATTLQAADIVIDCELDIVTPYSAGATITVGNATTANLLMATGDNNPQAAALYQAHQDTAFAGGPATVLVTVAGAPAAGAGFAIVRYVQAPQP